MGMFNYVLFFFFFPVCGDTVTGFQTKDDHNDDLALYWVLPHTVSNFHSFCKDCKLCLEFSRGKLDFNACHFCVHGINVYLSECIDSWLGPDDARRKVDDSSWVDHYQRIMDRLNKIVQEQSDK